MFYSTAKELHDADPGSDPTASIDPVDIKVRKAGQANLHTPEQRFSGIKLVKSRWSIYLVAVLGF